MTAEMIQRWLRGDRAVAARLLADARCEALTGPTRGWLDVELLLLCVALDDDDDTRVLGGLEAIRAASRGDPGDRCIPAG